MSLIVITPCVITILIYNDKITQNSPVYYKEGVELYNSGDYSKAFYKFLKIKWISPLYPMALYKQAKSAQQLGDYQTAVLKYELFLGKNPDSVFAKTAQYNLAKCCFYLKQYDKAKEKFIELKQRNDYKPSNEDFYLGLIEKAINKEQALNYFRHYLKGVLSGEIEDKSCMIQSADEIYALEPNLSNTDKELLGRVYYVNHKYSKALELFSELPLDSYWDYLVIINHNIGNKVIAKKLIETGIGLYSPISNEDRLHKIYDIYASYLPGVKIRNWTQILKLVQTNSLKSEDYVMYKLAGMLPEDKALLLYKNIVDKYPLSNYAPESLWKIFWKEYKNRNYINALNYAQIHLKNYPNVNSTTRIMFWLSKLQAQLNNYTESEAILTKLASKYPDDYYGLRAEYILNKKTDFWQTNPSCQIVHKPHKNFPVSLSNIDIKDLKLINTIFSLGDYEIWQDADFENKIVESWFEQKKDKKSRSVVLARDMIKEMPIKPPFISAAYKLAYPLHWTDEINIAGKKFHIDPWLIMSLIREESCFNEYAKSPSNALGLMQLMPGTANFIISKYSLNIPSLDELTNPRINLFLGCTYLRYLNDRFNNNELYVIAAYNGGEGSVYKWIKNSNPTDDYDVFVENIPYEETRNYVKKIFRSYHLYKKIYE